MYFTLSAFVDWINRKTVDKKWLRYLLIGLANLLCLLLIGFVIWRVILVEIEESRILEVPLMLWGLLGLYFMPTLFALFDKKKNAFSVFIVNLFAGRLIIRFTNAVFTIHKKER